MMTERERYIKCPSHFNEEEKEYYNIIQDLLLEVLKHQIEAKRDRFMQKVFEEWNESSPHSESGQFYSRFYRDRAKLHELKAKNAEQLISETEPQFKDIALRIRNYDD